MKINKKKQDEFLVKQWFKLMVIFITLLTFLVSINTIYRGFNITRSADEIKYIYNNKNAVDYKVYMFDNSFFEEDFLGMNKQYTAKLVDKITIDFYNSLSISKLSNMEYSYNVRATINGKYQSDVNSLDSSLWTKGYILVDEVSNNINQVSKNDVTLPIEINFNYYKDLVTDFQKQMRLDIEATLDVDFTINYKFYIDGDKILKSETINLKIPLSEPTFKITTNYSEVDDEVVFNELQSKYNVWKIVDGFILLAGSLFGGIAVILMLVKDTKKTEYVLKLNKILKDYGDIIAETANLPDLENQDILEIKEFLDLVDIEEELKIPIIYCEIKKNKEGWFLLIHNQHTYRYILKESNSKKK